MYATKTGWVEDLLRLNGQIVATEQGLSVQAGRIMDALEMREDIGEAEALFVRRREHLRALRRIRNGMLAWVRTVG